jgi:Mu-like prophage major head subunit gpT
MRTTLLQDYYELRESGSTSDYPNLLGNVMYRSLLDWVKTVPDAWRQYAAIGDLSDFRPATRIVGYESEDLLPVGEDGVYQDSKLADAAYTVQLGTYGRAFSVNRNVIINDDLGYIKQQPKRFGRAAARGIAKFVAQTLLEGNGNCFDGVALFDTSTHKNNTSGAPSALSAGNLQTGISAMNQQVVLGVYHTVTPKWLLVPTALQFTARQILNSAIIAIAGTAGTITTMGNANVLQGALGIIVDPFLTVQTQYYVLADPAEAPVVDVAFLQGKQTPDLLVERPVMMNLAGGDDPYEFEFDVMRYKVRYDYGGASSLWWGGYRFVGA